MTGPSDSPERPLGGRTWTPGFLALFVTFLVAVALIVWRFVVGLGPPTALSDGYPWGIWIAYDVVIGTALASGGFAVALLVFVLNRWRYHPLVRPALLTAALGYTIAIISLVVDVGRPWNFWKVPVFVGDWNSASPLLEVALCVAAYTFVLWLEVSQMFFERWAQSGRPRLRAFAMRATAVLRRALPWVVAVGVVLPIMHQSSLGTLMVLAGHKLHPVWQTPALPLLFLLSSFVMGLGAVVLETSLSALRFRRPTEGRLLAALLRVGSATLVLYVVVRFVDLAVRGALGHVAALDRFGLLFWIETVLFLVPAVMLWGRRAAPRPATLFRAALLMLVAGSLYRFDSFLVAFDPGAGWSYFPSVAELLISGGLVALEIMLYLAIVRRFPVLRGSKAASAGGAG
jgi:Ni/Fe-hydrogenase subunit HybB-like protein